MSNHKLTIIHCDGSTVEVEPCRPGGSDRIDPVTELRKALDEERMLRTVYENGRQMGFSGITPILPQL